MKRLALATLGLSLALAVSQPAHAGPAGLADSVCNFDRHVQYSVGVSPPNPCPGQPLSLVVKGCRGCDVPVYGVFPVGGAVQLRFDVSRYCLDVACIPESVVVPIGEFQAGTHTLTLQITAYVVDAFPDSSCVVTQTDPFTFSVGDSCPPPPPTGLPFVTRVQIGAPPPCIECPPRICAGDSIPVLIQGVFPNDCWDVFAVRVDSTLHQVPFVRLVVARKISTNCLIPTERPFEAAVMMPGRPQGPSELLVEEDWVTESSPGIPDSVFQAVFPFMVSEPCSTVTPPPPASFVRTVTVGRAPCAGCPPIVCPGDSIPVRVTGEFPDPCWQFTGIELVPAPFMNPLPYPPIVRVHVVRTCAQICPTVITPFSGVAMLPPLPIGGYALWVEEARDVPCDPPPGSTTGQYLFRLPDVPFTVAPSCSATISLPFVTLFHVGPLFRDPCPRCVAPPICPGDSIPVQVAGVLPDNCWRFDGLQLLTPIDFRYPGPHPPIVRIRLSRNDCLGVPCDRLSVPFSGAINLPPLPAGGYQLTAQETWGSWCNPDRVDSLFQAFVPFAVSPNCSTTVVPGCQMVDWMHDPSNPSPCDAFVSKLSPAQLDMGINTTVPLAGIQGDIHMDPPGLVITQLQPIGAAEGWGLAWQQTADGAKFVLIGTGGQVIDPVLDPNHVPHGQPILRITAAMLVRNTLQAPRTTVYATLLASDPHGETVPMCPILVLPMAGICYGSPACDLNHDGMADIRDLVLMVNCLLGRSGWCPDSSLAALDCNGDGQKNLDDVMCCASTVLRGGMPDTTNGRPEPSVQLSFGVPVPTSRGIDVAVRIDGADRLGAARLALRYPSDRFDVLSVEGPTDQWLCLHQVSGSDLTVGLISLDLPTGGAQSASSLAFTLHLALKPGQQVGGEVKLAGGEFSGPDGVALKVNLLPTSVPTGGATRAMLSAAQPNPFNTGTRFAVTLPRAADVELAVYDLAGRRMATLYRGRVEAGTRSFSWSGARDDGTRAPDGAYFLRLRAGGEDATRKVVFLRGR